MINSHSPGWQQRVRDYTSKEELKRHIRSIRKGTGPWFKLAWQDLKEDCKKTRWIRGIAWILLAMAFGFAVALVSNLPAMGESDTGCNPDGTFSYDSEYNVWKPDNLFEVTLRSRPYSFGVVKLIDIIWDVVIGRGGQGVLAYISYIVMTRFLTFQMTQAPIAIPVYKRVFMEPELGVRSTFCLLWDFFKYKPLQSKLGMLWIILTSIFVIAFPTLTSAMTSYTPTITPFLKNGEGNLVPFSSVGVKRVDYIIRDASRLDGLKLSDGYPILPLSRNSSRSLDLYLDDCTVLDGDPDAVSMCNFRNATSAYVAKYGFRGLQKVNSSFMGLQLGPPTLNIEGSYYSNDDIIAGWNWSVPGTGEIPYSKPENQLLMVDGDEIMTRGNLKRAGRCQPDNDTFQWGFSFLLLFVLLISLILWGLATYLIWLQSHFALRYLEPTDEVAGEYTAAFRLATALRQEFKAIGHEPDQLSEAEIKRKLRYTLGGGCIEQATIKGGTATVREMRIAHMDARLEEHKWWILAFVLTTGVGGVIIPLGGAAGIIFGFPFCGAGFGIMVSGFMGWRLRSRQLSVLFWTLAGFIVGISLAATFWANTA